MLFLKCNVLRQDNSNFVRQDNSNFVRQDNSNFVKVHGNIILCYSDC